MDAIFFIILVAIAIAALATYLYLSWARARRATSRLVPAPTVAHVRVKSAVEPVAAVRTAPPATIVTPEPSPLFDLDLEPALAVPPPVEIRWSKQFDPRSETLDEMSRLRLIGDLGVVGKEWCVPLLAQAYEEERRPGHRQAALIALTACHSRAAAATFRSALQSNDPAERAIAADGLADLEPSPQSKPRRIVERH